MSQIHDLHISRFVEGIAVAARHVQPLAERLENVKPIDIDAAERAALDSLKRIALEVRDVKTEREHEPIRIRPAYDACQLAWGAVAGALTAASAVPIAVSDRGKRAGALLGALFPVGVGFVKLDAPALWAEAARRMHRIDHESLRAPLTEIVSADLVLAAEQATEQLAEAIGVGRVPRPHRDTTELSEKRQRFSRAVARYGRILAAKLDEDDPASIARFKSAVAPMDEYRISPQAADLEDEDVVDPVATDPPQPPTA